MFSRSRRVPVWAALSIFLACCAAPAIADHGHDASLPAEILSGKGEPLSVRRDGVLFRAYQVDPQKKFDTSVLPADEGLARLEKAYALLIASSPYSARQIRRLKEAGQIQIDYIPDDLNDAFAKNELIAVFMPDAAGEAGARHQFRVAVGRHGIKWPTAELAGVLAHELVGHAMQQYRGKLTAMRQIDLECEARLYQQLAYQDLGIARDTAEMNAFRQNMESQWCADFIAFSRQENLPAAADWARGAPDILRLAGAFELYLKYNEENGVTAAALRTAERLHRTNGALGSARLRLRPYSLAPHDHSK